MKKNESPNVKPKKLTLNQETLANLRNGNTAPNALRPTNPPGCSGPTWGHGCY